VQPADRMPGLPILLAELQRLEEGLGLEPAAAEPRQREPGTDRDTFDHHEAMLMMERESRLRRPSGSRTAMFSAFALVLAVLAIGLTGFLYFSQGTSEHGVATAPPPVAEAAREPAPAPVALPASPPAAEPAPPARAESPVVRQSEPLPAAAAAPAPEPVPVPQPTAKIPPEPVPVTQPTAKIPEEQPGGSARLILAVSPRGEIYIDGKLHGTTPPITTLDLEPGMRRVEVRNGSRKPYLTYMTVQAGEVRRIQHDFNAKPMRPPG